MTHRLFCFGLGYSALALARRLRARGWSVAGTCRSPESRMALTAEGFGVSLVSRDQPPADADALLAEATHLLISVPPDAAGDPVIDLFGQAIRRRQDSGRPFAWAGYLSTTGVYGDRGGSWVDENDALLPTGERGQRRVDAENAWLALGVETGVPVQLFRLAGIYGPGRSALDTIRSGRAQRVVKPGQVFSRIHVEDIATVLEASIARPNPGAAYNVCDDDPAPPDEVLAFAAGLLGVAPPPAIPFEDAVLSDMARSFYADNKRVSNRRIKQELGVQLAYPSYRDGLDALIRSGN
jgi:nucleoside-diphosphate-sugar epimerase